VDHVTKDVDMTNAERVILVPFSVPSDGMIEVATIIRTVALQFKPGEYELSIAHWRLANDKMSTILHFRPVDSQTHARIVRADSALAPFGELVMSAEPA